MFDSLDVMFTEYASKIMDCKTTEAIDVSAVSAGLASSLIKKIAKVSDHVMCIKPMTEKTLARTLLVKCKLKPVGEIYKKVAIPVDYLDLNPVPELVLEFINLKPIISTLNNLLAPVMQALGISVVRDDNSLNVTNTVDYY